MATATVTSPLASSQLFFDWSDGGEPLRPQERLTQTPVSQAPAQPRRQNQQGNSKHPAAAPAANSEQLAAEQPGVREASRQADASRASQLSFTANQRIAKPVKIGPVMIKLLKRYGVTDQEIQAGLATYALKHQPAIAS